MRVRLSHLTVSLFFGLFGLGATLFFVKGQALSALAADCEVPSSHPTIQSAIDDALCQTIRISSGTYAENLMISRSVSLIGAGPDLTTVDAGRSGRPLTVNGSASEQEVSVFLEGLRVRNGDATSGSTPMTGGGILVTGGARIDGENLQIDNNLASSSVSGYGGGLAIRGGSAFFTDTRILSNTANERAGNSEGSGYGGGLYVEDGVLHLSDSQVVENLASLRANGSHEASGGGLYITEDTQVFMSGNVWTGNIARGNQSSPCSLVDCSGEIDNEGGGAVGVFLSSGSVEITITNDVFAGNVANEVVTTELNSGHGGAISFNTTGTGQITAVLRGVTLNQNLAARTSTNAGEEGRGGAIYARRTDLEVKQALLFDNRAVEDGNGSGGGIYFHFPGDGESFELENSVLAGNMACTTNNCGDGAQVYIDYSNAISNTARIVHTTIADAGINPRQGIFYTTPFGGDSLYITNTIIASHAVGIENHNPLSDARARYVLFHGNSTEHVGTAFPDTIGHVPGQPDPLFVDPEDQDYHLRSGSPAIDNGTNAGISEDIDGDSRPQGVGFDIGADEFLVSAPADTPTVTSSTTPTPSAMATATPPIPPTALPPASQNFLPLVIR
jgi:hypothetical protein